MRGTNRVREEGEEGKNPILYCTVAPPVTVTFEPSITDALQEFGSVLTVIFVAVTDGLVVPAPMATLPEDTDVQPAALVTVKVYVVLADKPVIVLLVPVPVVVLPPGILVNVQVPEAGKPFNTTEPVGVLQLGWVIVPTAGAAGKAGAALIATLFEGTETQPTSLVTVKVYVALAGKPDTVVVVPVPVVVPPGSWLRSRFL